MEKWQSEAIKNNLVKLLKLTRCNEILLANLIARDVLTTEEKDLINSTPVQAQKADKLYEIILGRVGAFNILLDASKETTQTGVVKILEDAERDYNFSIALNECVEDDFSYQNMNPLFLTTNLSFESIRRAIANYVDLKYIKIAFDIGRPIKPWLLRGPNNETLLHISAAYGDCWLMEYLISIGLDLGSMDIHGRTACHNIGKFSANIIATTKIFLENGINLRQVDKDGMTIANSVALHGRINQFHYHNWVKFMIKNDYSDLFAQTAKNGTSPLNHALEMLDLEKATVELILNLAKTSVNRRDLLGRSILHWALMSGRCLKTIKNLLELGVDYKMKDKNEEGALHFAVKGGREEVITFLITLNTDINEEDELGETSLHKIRFTKTRDYFKMTNFLLGMGADLCAKDKNRNTIAHLVALDQNISSDDFRDWVKGMVDNGHSRILALRGQFGRTPIQIAMQRLDLDLDTIGLILKSSQTDVNLQDRYRNTVLHLAIASGRNIQTVKDLIRSGANITLKDEKGAGVLHFSIIRGNKEVIQYLILEVIQHAIARI